MRRVLVVLAFLVIVALLGVDVYVRVKPPKWASAPTPCPRPSPCAEITPTATPVPVDAAAALTPRPGAGEIIVQSPARARVEPPARPVAVAAATAAPTAVGVATVKPSAAPTARKPKPRAAKPSPTPPPARPDGSVSADAARRGFVTGETSFASGETQVATKETAGGEVPAGFDPGGVAVKAAPKVAARVEFDVQPKRLRPGDPYVVKVYLRNDGKKTSKIRELRVASALNGVRSESALTPKMKEIPAQQVALLAEVPSVWKADVKAWSMEVSVRSGHGDIYTNTVRWR